MGSSGVGRLQVKICKGANGAGGEMACESWIGSRSDVGARPRNGAANASNEKRSSARVNEAGIEAQAKGSHAETV